MSEPFIGEIKLVGFSFAPNGWATCDGQLLAIAQNSALFSLVGTYYGGDGRTTFGLPDLRGRFPMHQGAGPGLSPRNMGQSGGAESVTLTTNQLPSHSHSGHVVSGAGEGDRANPSGAYPAVAEEPLLPYGGTGTVSMGAGSVQTDAVGAGQSVPTMPPFRVINFVIALVGIYPSRS